MKTYVGIRTEQGCSVEVHTQIEVRRLDDLGKAVDWARALSRGSLHLAWLLLEDSLQGYVPEPGSTASCSCLTLQRELIDTFGHDGWVCTDEEVRQAYSRIIENDKKSWLDEQRFFEQGGLH